VWSVGTVAPSANFSSELPRWSSTYFRPSAERGRILISVSTGISPAAWSSFRRSSATVVPSGSAIGVIVSTTPMRKPPSRTSLPSTRFAPLGICTTSWRVGTKGRPAFAL
jgi:hypothetical protein